MKTDIQNIINNLTMNSIVVHKHSLLMFAYTYVHMYVVCGYVCMHYKITITFDKFFNCWMYVHSTLVTPAVGTSKYLNQYLVVIFEVCFTTERNTYVRIMYESWWFKQSRTSEWSIAKVVVYYIFTSYCCLCLLFGKMKLLATWSWPTAFWYLILQR